MWVALNKKNIVAALSEHPFSMTGYSVRQLDLKEPKEKWHSLIGKKLNLGDAKEVKNLRIAFVCNWNDNCGISTYSSYLVDALKTKVKELHVFSESGSDRTDDPPYVTRCWKRGTSLKGLIDKIVEWAPDFIIIQHEFGIFPKATYFLQLLQGIEDIPYVVTMHSVYEHLDKSICTSAVKDIVVHSEEGKKVLKKLGNANNIYVVPHGCVQFNDEDKTELWNIFQTPYTIVQFGFGFFYKGVDRVLDAIHYLKRSDPKFKDIFYCYLCSDNYHTSVVHTQYYDFLIKKIDELSLHDNAVIIRKFQTDQMIKNYLRTAKIAVFPYVGDPKNMVYGASGAIRIAMACGIPVIASSCHQFDDLEDVVPRPANFAELADEIDEVFSNHNHRKSILAKSEAYMAANTWGISADRYINLYYQINS
jgi:glycosyltransferase involved in cell wall biosynthesis